MGVRRMRSQDPSTSCGMGGAVWHEGAGCVGEGCLHCEAESRARTHLKLSEILIHSARRLGGRAKGGLGVRYVQH